MHGIADQTEANVEHKCELNGEQASEGSNVESIPAEQSNDANVSFRPAWADSYRSRLRGLALDSCMAAVAVAIAMITATFAAESLSQRPSTMTSDDLQQAL